MTLKLKMMPVLVIALSLSGCDRGSGDGVVCGLWLSDGSCELPNTARLASGEPRAELPRAWERMLDVAIRRWAGIGDQQISDERHNTPRRVQQLTNVASGLERNDSSIWFVAWSRGEIFVRHRLIDADDTDAMDGVLNDWYNRMGWMTTEQNPAFRAIALPIAVKAVSECDVGVWTLESEMGDRMWGQEINTRHGETAVAASHSHHPWQQYLRCTIPPLIQSWSAGYSPLCYTLPKTFWCTKRSESCHEVL